MTYEHTTTGSVTSGRQQPHSMREKATRKIQDAGEYVKEKASDVSRQVQHGASAAKDWLSQTMDEYPLAMGAGFVLLGLASGFALPTTKPEKRYIGQTGRKFMHQAQEVGSRIIDRGEEAAERAIDAVRGSIKREPSSPSP
jgi:hypothetical protein